MQAVCGAGQVGATSAVEGPNGSDALYSLFAVIVHVGSGMDHGAPRRAAALQM